MLSADWLLQEVFPDGLVAGDGRLQPGDQIIEINGTDMTCATHSQVSQGDTDMAWDIDWEGILKLKSFTSPSINIYFVMTILTMCGLCGRSGVYYSQHSQQ